MLKAVVDTSVWVSALLTRGKPRELLNRFEDGLFTATSPHWLVEELRKIPAKPRLSHDFIQMTFKI